ncbi:putative disease resistance protein At1g50180 isoform X2 [Apium graveolens]|uniref:putative disease resistance protein At1g50180 isoform X2 n=1 Tax=Apium graveolens TaxID=4045 RepID=UPI003D793630
MVEVLVSFAVKRLGELLISEARLLYEVRDQIMEIQRELERMHCFLEEADKKQILDKRVKKWVAEIRELAFRVQDVIEIFALEVPSLSTRKQKIGFKMMLRRCCCMLSEALSRHKIDTDINGIKSELANLTERLPTYGITEGLAEGETSISLVNLKSRRNFYSHDVEKDFVGMQKEIGQLISHLKKEDKGYEVISICGMGGLGKTTLAKKLYNHAQVRSCFKAFAWVCITQQFEREKVLMGVLRELVPAERKEEVSMMDDSKLVKELYNLQQEKKCLIVIDDIWTINSWRSIRSAFPVGNTSGSKILLTTRNVKVANIGSVYKIEGLTEEEGWQLLAKKAKINYIPENRQASEMERIGRNMVKRCKGLPLAISSLGGMLKGKLLSEWKKVLGDISFYLDKGEGIANDNEYNTVTQVLGLSYDSLPPRLRHCFLCFANHKEDEEIRTEDLYMFWVAEGLISAEDKAENEMMLDVAERYLDELANRSLVQVEASENDGASWSKYRTCHVHDLIRDLCLSKVKEENFISVIYLPHDYVEDVSKGSITRRLCIRSNHERDYESLFPNGLNVSILGSYDHHVISRVRSISIWYDRSKDTARVLSNATFSLEKFKLLRVLTMRRLVVSTQNVRQISELVYLNYLSLAECRLEELSSSIGNLQNLETLDLRMRDTIRIPNVLSKLKQLKHLYLPEYFEEYGIVEKLRFEGLNELELLYNYDTVHCDEHDLIQLPKLQVFRGIIEVKDILTKDIINFIKSKELRHSHLVFQAEYDHTRFSVQLTQLQFLSCKMEKDPMLLLKKLPNLRTLYLGEDAYLGEELVCSATGFLQLQQLDLQNLSGLRRWRVDEGVMPNLYSLRINGCQLLEMLPRGLSYLTALKHLHITCMPTAFTNRVKVIDGVEGEDFHKVRCIPNVLVID